MCGGRYGEMKKTALRKSGRLFAGLAGVIIAQQTQSTTFIWPTCENPNASENRGQKAEHVLSSVSLYQ